MLEAQAKKRVVPDPEGGMNLSIPENPTPKTLRTPFSASDGLLLAPVGPLSDVDLGLIPECAPSEPLPFHDEADEW